jgi:hypothetical protein
MGAAAPCGATTTETTPIRPPGSLREPEPALLRPSRAGATQSYRAAEHARQDSNLQPPVLETGALPIELRA